jgi:hypothetical protein
MRSLQPLALAALGMSQNVTQDALGQITVRASVSAVFALE